MDRILESLVDFATLGPALLFVLIVSDVVRGWMAYRCGDRRLELKERLTLSPIVHFDLLGTLILPVFLMLLHSPLLLGWTKPMPIVFSNLRDPARDTVKVELVGLGALLLMGFLGALGLILIIQFVPEDFYYARPLRAIFEKGLQLPFIFFIFSLLPTPGRPLTNILMAKLPAHQSRALLQFGPQLQLIVLIGIMSGLLGPVIVGPASFLIRLALSLAQSLVVAFLQILSLGGVS